MMNIYFALLFKTSLILIRDIPFGYLIMIPVSTMSIKLFSPFLVSFNLVLPSVITVRGLIRRHLLPSSFLCAQYWKERSVVVFRFVNHKRMDKKSVVDPPKIIFHPPKITTF